MTKMERILALVFLSISLDIIFAQEVQVMFEPAQFNAAVGSIASSRCHLVPNTEAAADYQWFDKRGNPITSRNSNNDKWLRDPFGDQKGLLLMVRVTADDEGVYQCKVTVDGNEYTGNFRLEVYQPITFSNCPEQQNGVKGEEGRMSCSASAGAVSVTPYWERDGTLIKPSQRFRFDGISMIISNVTEADKGVYTYTAVPNSNSGLAIKSRPINFDVWTKPVFTKPLLETTGVDGGNATLYCEAVGHPEVEFSWYKENSMVRDTGRIKIVKFKHQSQLQFRPVMKDDRGTYLCQVRNAAGTKNESTQVIVQTPARIQPTRNESRVEGSAVELFCNATGEPVPFIEIFKMDTGVRITTGDQSQGYKVESGSLPDKNNPGTWFKLGIKNLKYSDAGNYKCEALNNAGEDQAVINLAVLFAPKTNKQPDGPFYNWKGNTDGHLPCVASANPLPLFRWLRADGREITSADPFFSIVREEHQQDKVKYPNQESEKYTVTSKLMITYNGQNDNEVFGRFTCEARNQINKTVTELTMIPAAAPGQPAYSFSRETPTLINISFVGQGVAGPPITGYKAVISRRGSAEEPIVVTAPAEWREWSDDLPGGEKRTIMTVRGLEPATDYSITLYAVNAVGEGTPIELPYTTKARSVPSSVPVISGINSPYPGAIVIRWEHPENGGSPIMHYLVGYRQVNIRNTTNQQGGYEYASSMPNPAFRDIQLKSDITTHTIQNLLSGKYYQVRVIAVNNIGKSLPLNKIIKTKEAELAPGATTADDSGLSTGIIIGIVVAIFVVLFIIVDLTCYFKNNCGILMCIREKIAGARDEGYSAAKTDESETLAKKDQLDDAKSAEEGEMAAEQEEEKKEPLLSEEQVVETVDEGEKMKDEMEPEEKEMAKQPETIDNKENEAAQEAKTEEESSEEKKDEEKKG